MNIPELYNLDEMNKHDRSFCVYANAIEKIVKHIFQTYNKLNIFFIPLSEQLYN